MPDSAGRLTVPDSAGRLRVALSECVAALRAVRRGRQAAQDFVEYGLIVAAIAFVGMIGFNAIGRAEATILKADSLDAPAPPVGYFLHPTQTTLACPPANPGPEYLADGTSQLVCTVSVQDTYSPSADRTVPRGSVTWNLDGTSNACSALVAQPAVAPNPADTATCQFPILLANPLTLTNPHNLFAQYSVQTSKHSASQSTPPFQFTVIAKIDFNFNCMDPSVGGSTLWTTQFGVPLHCTLQLADESTSGPSYGKTVTISSTAANGWSYFSCWIANPIDPTEEVNDCPQPAPTWTCTTDATGYCLNAGERDFEYRLDIRDDGLPTAPVTLNLVAHSPPQHDALSTNAITVNPNSTPHPTGVVLHCSGPDSGYVVSPYGQIPVRGTTLVPGKDAVASDANLLHSGPPTGSVNCTALAMDLSQNPMTYDWGCNGSGGTQCDINKVDQSPPLGTVTVTVYDRAISGCPTPTDCGPGDIAINLPQGGVFSCGLGHPAQNPTVPSSPPSSAYYPTQPTGQQWNALNSSDPFVSWCGVSINFPQGHFLVRASYNGSGAHLGSGVVPGFASRDLTVDIN